VLCGGNAFIVIFRKERKEVHVVEVSRQCPLVMADRDRKNSEVCGRTEGSMLRSGLLEAKSVGKTLSIWAEFCVFEAKL